MGKEIYNKKQDKILFIIRIVASVLVIIFGMLQLLSVWNKAIYVVEPLLGVVLLIQSIQEWKTNRGVSVFVLICSLCIFICAVVAFFSL